MTQVKRIKLKPKKSESTSKVSSRPRLRSRSIRKVSKTDTKSTINKTTTTSKKNTRKKESENIFKKANTWINNLSTAQFGILVIVILGIGILIYKPLTDLSISSSISSVTSNIPGVDKGPDCNKSINKLNPTCWDVVPQLPEKDGLTNALLIGVDTRDGESGLMNTDVMMVASHDHATGTTSLISFPRDLYVPLYLNGNKGGNVKINSIYAIGEQRNGTTGQELLQSNIEEYLDIDIHYTGIVNFKALIEAVDAIGGIDIELEKKYTDIYPYDELSDEYKASCRRASDKYHYCVFDFEEGTNHLNGEDALIYARMRQYSSDFDRARRQQEVISAVKNKLLADDQDLFDIASDGWDIYSNSLEAGYIKSDIEYSDMIAALFLAKDMDLKNIEPINIVLDPNFGGAGKYMFATSVGGNAETGEGGIYAVKLRGDSFALIRKELEEIRKSPNLYQDKASVVLSNKTGVKFPLDSTARKLYDNQPYTDGFFSMTGKVDGETGVKILVFNHEKRVTTDYLAEYFKADDVEVIYVPEEYTEDYVGAKYSRTTGYKEDIRIEVNKVGAVTEISN